MNDRALIQISFLLVVGGFVCGGLRAEASDRRKPNVVYMMLDEIGYCVLFNLGEVDWKT